MKLKTLFFSMIGLSMLASCNNDSELVDMSSKKSYMQVVPTVEGETHSRAYQNEWASGNIIGWYLANTGTTYLGTSYMNKKLTYTTSWALETTPMLTGTAGTLYAYYPWVDKLTAFTAIPMTITGQTDYMWGTQSGFTAAANSKALTMKHALTRIKVLVKKGTYAYTGSVSAVKVNSAALGTTGTLNATNGVVTVTAGTSTDITLGGSTQTIDTTGKSWESMILAKPATPGAVKVSVVLDGITYSTTTTAITAEAGKIHTITVTANSTGLSVSSVTMTPWASGTGATGTIQ